MSSNRILPARRGWEPGYRSWMLLVTVILFVAAAFRMVGLDEVPPGLAQDEILDADIAAFIRAGEHALFFSHGYGHEPLYHYIASPFAVLFGDNFLAIRLPSVFLGLLLIALTLRWGRRNYGPVVALVAGVGLAASWWPIIFSRIGIRPILEPVLLVLAMLFWPLRATVLSRGHIISAGVAGIWLGLSIYSYTAARIILLIPGLLLLVLILQLLIVKRIKPADGLNRIPLSAQIVFGSIILFIGSLLYLPLAVTLRANPGLQQRIEQLEGPIEAMRAGDFTPVLESTVATLGVFSFSGDPRWTYGLPNRPLFDPIIALFFYWGLIIALWRWKHPEYLILPIWLLVALLPSALSPDAPSTVRLVGAMPVVYLLPGLAAHALTVWVSNREVGRHKSSCRSTQHVILLLLGLLCLFGYRTIRDGFIRWPREMETGLRYQTALRDIGRYWLDNGDAAPPVVAEVFFEPIDRDSLRRSIGLDPAARWIQTGAGVAGALVWPEGNEAHLYVPEYAPLNPELMNLGEVSQKPIIRQNGSVSFAVHDLIPISFPDAAHQEKYFGDGAQMALLGISAPELIEDGLQLATWWRIGNNLTPDLAIFVHLIDSAGNVTAQHDGLDAAPATLLPRDVVLQRHVLPVPEAIDAGAYSLHLGIYERSSGERLLLNNGKDSIEIGFCEAKTELASALSCSLTKSK